MFKRSISKMKRIPEENGRRSREKESKIKVILNFFKEISSR